MLAGSWAWIVVAVEAALVVAAVGGAAYLLRGRRGEGTPDLEAWRTDARDLAREVEGAAATADPPADHDQVARRLLPLSARIQGHVRAAPSSVDEAAYRDLYELGVACQRVALEHRPVGTASDGVFLEERLSALREEAEALARTVEGDRKSTPREKSENAT